MMRQWMALVLLAVLAAPLHAQQAQPLAEDPVLERRLQLLAQDLRCLVCQNESLAGSNADLAVDLRREIRDMMRDGKSDREITDFLVQRYGDFVLYRPPVQANTVLLWGGPFLLLGVGALVLVVYVRRRRTRVVEVPLSEEEQRRAFALLHDIPPEDRP